MRLQAAVEQLSVEEMKRFRDWFAELEARLWDQQIEQDLKAGKLDKRAERWRADYKAWRFTEIC